MSRTQAAMAMRRSLALSMLMLATQAANATYVTGHWQTTYGSPFTDLGWRGTVTVDVPAACLAQSGPAAYPATGLCSPVSVLDAKVYLYDTTDILATTIETLDFTPSLVLTSVGVLSPGVLLGLQGMSAPVTADESALAQFAATYASFSLELDYTLGDGPTARMLWSVDPLLCGTNPAECSGANSADFAPVVSFSAVPEPGSLALAAVAMLAGSLARRRVGGR